MDEKSLEILEFPKVREIIAGFTSFSAARELALNLKPHGEYEVISRLLGEVKEARHLLSLEPGFAIGDVQDVREAAEMAARGKVLDPPVLVGTKKAMATARHIRGSLSRRREKLPLLWDMVKDITSLPDLESDIARCLSPNGEILDTASERLLSIKESLRETRRRLLNRLDGMLRSQSLEPYLQEMLITEREGRYVIPVKSEFRREIKGIVHDVSNTGATVFVEPLEMVDLGNELRELTLKEKSEVERILSSLSASVGVEAVGVSRNIALLASLELTLAKARYAEKVKAVQPVVLASGGNGESESENKQRILRLVDARHPLLREKAVPISLEIGRDFSVLVITGPNTGGKTVTLKTIGLLSLMAQSGIPIPAGEGSFLPVFDSVFANIGDEQSIEQTFSSFSWHISSIISIIKNATTGSLVLLDELGTSTDPQEGAALARAILLYFLSQGIMAVATTHFGELKVFAHTTPGIENASLDFDPVTLTPTYHLTIGMPGGSNALAVASRLGLPQEIIEKARGMLSKGAQELESLLLSLMEEKQRLEAVRRDLERAQNEVERQKVDLKAQLGELKEEEKRLIQETRDRLVMKTAELQKEIRRTLSELKRAKALEDIERAKKTLSLVRGELGRDVLLPSTGRRAEPERIAVGDNVWVLDTNLKGTVRAVSAKGRQIEVQVGNTKLRVSPESLVKVEEKPKEASPSVVVRATSAPRARPELDLRGKRVGEIEADLDSYLSNAALGELSQVRIVHGVGTGALRQVVREFLRGHPLVKSFRPGGQGEGGDGVTLVQL